MNITNKRILKVVGISLGILAALIVIFFGVMYISRHFPAPKLNEKLRAQGAQICANQKQRWYGYLSKPDITYCNGYFIFLDRGVASPAPYYFNRSGKQIAYCNPEEPRTILSRCSFLPTCGGGINLCSNNP